MFKSAVAVEVHVEEEIFQLKKNMFLALYVMKIIKNFSKVLHQKKSMLKLSSVDGEVGKNVLA